MCLLCYYLTFKVIRAPPPSQPHLSFYAPPPRRAPSPTPPSPTHYIVGLFSERLLSWHGVTKMVLIRAYILLYFIFKVIRARAALVPSLGD